MKSQSTRSHKQNQITIKLRYLNKEALQCYTYSHRKGTPIKQPISALGWWCPSQEKQGEKNSYMEKQDGETSAMSML